MNKVTKIVIIGVYQAIVAFMAFGMFVFSFLSNGPTPVYIHILFPLAALLIFEFPFIVWYIMKSKILPLPGIARKYQDQIIAASVFIWAVGVASIYIRGYNQ